MPSKYIVDAYEDKKRKYLLDLTTGFKEEIEKANNKGKIPVPTPEKIQVYTLRESGKKWKEIMEIMDKNRTTITRWYEEVKDYNHLLQKRKENRAIVVVESDFDTLNKPIEAV
jgi:DNA invertase Pin-like site-specific DNA recombinase